MHNRPAHYLLLLWLILSGLIGAALYISWEQGLIQLLFGVDKSGLSWVIALVYCLVTLHCTLRIIIISTEHKETQWVVERFLAASGSKLHFDGQTAHLNQVPLPDCLLTEYLQDVYTRKESHGEVRESRLPGDNPLLEVYESRLKGPQEIGWFISDVMLKLGLLGTIIGFIFMLGSVTTIADFDVSTMQQVLRHMSNGMGTALYTTFAGLTGCVLASMQYHMLDKHCDEILMMIRHLSYTHINPELIEQQHATA